ncbi:FHIPEP family type III secretion protein, partial [Escherichia sp. TWPC-MK]
PPAGVCSSASDNGDIAHDVRNQLLASPSVLYTATGIMFVLAVVPGMPHLPFLLFSALLGFTGWRCRSPDTPYSAPSLSARAG